MYQHNGEMRARTVVLIDEHPRDQELFRRALQTTRSDCSAVVLKNPEQAFQYFFGNDGKDAGPAADLIVIDLLPAATLLPRLDGLKLLRLLQNSHRSSEHALPPIVAFSRAKSNAAIRQAYAYGATSYLFKPDEEDAFLATVEQLASYWLQLHRQPGSQPLTRWRRLRNLEVLYGMSMDMGTQWFPDTDFTEIGK